MLDDRTELAPPGEEALVIGQEYVIIAAEGFESDVNRYKGIRVVLDAGGEDQLAIALWKGAMVARTSKLGAFIVALGNQHADWIGHTIKIVEWEDKKRKVERID